MLQTTARGNVRKAARHLPVDLPPASLNMPGMTRSVLIADDDPHIRELLAFSLAKAG